MNDQMEKEKLEAPDEEGDEDNPFWDK
jgi:hypothetical protein